MADPLSVTASIAGLLVAAGQVTTTIHRFGSSIITASRTVQEVLSEVNNNSIVIRHLKSLLLTIERANDELANGKNHINTADFAMLLMSCMCTFAELQRLIDEVFPVVLNGKASSDGLKNMGLMNRLRWARKEAEIEKVLVRLMRHNISLSQMIDIIRCKSELQLRDLLKSYNRQIQLEIHKLDRAMSKRVQQVAKIRRESIYNQSIYSSLKPRSLPPTVMVSSASYIASTVRFSLNTSMRRTNGNAARNPTSTVASSGGSTSNPDTSSRFTIDFSTALWDSDVYRRSRASFSDSNLPFSAFDKNRGSKSSNFSISKISNISVFELPIYTTDLYNGSVYRNNTTTSTSTKRTYHHQNTETFSSCASCVSCASPPCRMATIPSFMSLQREAPILQAELIESRLYATYIQLSKSPRRVRGQEANRNKFPIDSPTLCSCLSALFDPEESLPFSLQSQFPEFFQAAQEYLYFYIDAIEPCVRRLPACYSTNRWREVTTGICHEYLAPLLGILKSPENPIYRRLRAGVMRDEQMRLAAFALYRSMEKLDAPCDLSFQIPMAGEDQLRNKQVNQLVKKISTLVSLNGRMFWDFLVDERFIRCERLGLLLTRYLGEDGGAVGTEVARKLDEMNSNRDWYFSCASTFDSWLVYNKSLKP